uniref:Ciliary neurotrophic factor n=1 Tax=Monopterus albus TaxID=43700 RepID=A0A3Q3J554_MONAL
MCACDPLSQVPFVYSLNNSTKHDLLLVLAFMLLEVQWRSVFSAPTMTVFNDIESAVFMVTLSFLQKNVHEPTGSIPNDVPESTISGATISEKLQDIYTKNVLFSCHISKVEEYQITVWGNPESIAQPLSNVKNRLHIHLVQIRNILENLYPEIPLPTTPPPPQVTHSYDNEKKIYGWGVIVALKDWLTQVLQVCNSALTFAGFLRMVCIWMVTVLPMNSGHSAGLSCRLKELTALTKHLVAENLASFVSNLL